MKKRVPFLTQRWQHIQRSGGHKGAVNFVIAEQNQGLARLLGNQGELSPDRSLVFIGFQQNEVDGALSKTPPGRRGQAPRRAGLRGLRKNEPVPGGVFNRAGRRRLNVWRPYCPSSRCSVAVDLSVVFFRNQGNGNHETCENLTLTATVTSWPVYALDGGSGVTTVVAPEIPPVASSLLMVVETSEVCAPLSTPTRARLGGIG